MSGPMSHHALERADRLAQSQSMTLAEIDSLRDQVAEAVSGRADCEVVAE